MAIVWLAAILIPLPASAIAGESFRFEAETNTLTVNTGRLELRILGGAAVAVRDLQTGEVFSEDADWHDVAKAGAGAVCGPEAAAAKRLGLAVTTVARKPQASSPVEFQQSSPCEGVLIYTGLSGSMQAASAADELRLYFRVEDRGELSFRMEVRLRDSESLAREVYLPFVKLTSPAVVLGSGERFARGDEAAKSRCMRIANNIYSPPVAVVEGRRGVLGLWPEPVSFGYDDLTLAHQPECDELVPQVCLAFNARDPDTANKPGVTRSSWWRVAALPSWLDVARRYRAQLEQRTGVKPLWEQTPAWVRNVHAVCKERPQTKDLTQADKFYADLAARFDPQKLLLFYWNGNCILLFGDHRYMTEFQYPTPAEIAALRKQGFRWLGYHPYVLVFSPQGQIRHLEEARRRGFGVPDDYAFQPDYAGHPEAAAFYDYFRPVAAGYYAKLEESLSLWTLHPGTQLVRDYLGRNVGNYCRLHEMSGCYFDILGADHAGQCLENAPDDRRIMEGNDWRRGEELACRAIKAANPDLAVMSEVQGDWTTVHTFYTWEGESHLTHPQPVRLNHPLRAACWGSYTWTQTDSPEAVALLAGLPAVKLADDWSVARGKLYMDEELFHDLPDQWDPDALAYFRAKGGRWFEYRRMPWGDAYVESSGGRVRLGRLLQQAAFPLSQPARIQNWAGYRDGRPIGLNPARTYDFMMEPPSPDGRVWLTCLPPGACITAIRHAPQQSVIEIGAAQESAAAEVEVLFHRDCLAVRDAAQDHAGPFPAGTAAKFTTRLPGGLVFAWQEPKPVDARFTSNFLGTSGHLRANGVPYDWWTYNSAIRSTTFTMNEQDAPTPVMELGTGLHRAWCDQWVQLSADAQPVLRFDLGYPASEDSKQRPPRPLIWSVRVNGAEVWRERVAPGGDWLPREVALAEYAGRTVLVTFSAEEESGSDVSPTHLLTPARLGNVRLENNPRAEGKPDGSRLPRPAKVLLEDKFEGPALQPDWATDSSPAQPADARIGPERGVLAITGEHYKYQYVRRPFPPEADTVQVLTMVRPTGCAARWNPGLGLWWGKDRWLFASLGSSQYVAELAAQGRREIPLPSTELPVYRERFYGWLRVTLTADKIQFWLSTDGKSWMPQVEFPRTAAYAGSPQQLLLGRGTGGPSDLFQNDERWPTGVNTCQLGDLVVGRDDA